MHDVDRLRLRITLDHPWLSALLYRLPLSSNTTIPTLITNGKTIQYNPDYLDSLTPDQSVGVICHELLHVGFLHHSRRGYRDILRWNCATDYAVNALLVETGIPLPSGCLINQKYTGLTAEAIYDLLPATPPKPLCALQEIKADASEDADLTDALTACLHDARRRGLGSESIDRLLGEALKPRIDWRDILAADMRRVIGQDDYCMRPSRRGLSLDCILPSLRAQAVSGVAIAVDTSGSMSAEELACIVGDIRYCVESVRFVDMLIIEADDRVQRMTEMSPGDDFYPKKLRGEGGTDFRPAITAAEQWGANAVIYVTDLDGLYPDKSAINIIWLSQSDFVPKLGRKIKIGGQNDKK